MQSRILLFIAGASISLAANSQKNWVRLDNIGNSPMTITYDLDEENDVEGSRVLYEDWKEIKVSRNDGMNILIPEGKYDLVLDQVILRQENGGTYQLDNKEEVLSFSIEDQQFVGSIYTGGQYGFFEVLYKGENVILYKKHYCLVVPGKPGNGIVEGTPDKYEPRKDYYVKREAESGEALKLKVTNKKILLKTYKFQELSDFLMKSKGNFREDEAIVNLFKDYDQSQKQADNN